MPTSRNAHRGTAIGASLRSMAFSMCLLLSVGVVVVGGGCQSVLAAVAVHAGLAGKRLGVPLEEGLEETVVDSEVGVDGRAGGPGLVADAVDEDPGEEEVRDHGDVGG